MDEWERMLRNAEEGLWLNPEKRRGEKCFPETGFGPREIREASERLERLAPVIRHCFPETESAEGIIESPLTRIPSMQKRMETDGVRIPGRLFLKRDSDLPISGSVKARGGIYEVLKHAEELALWEGILRGIVDDPLKLTESAARTFFGKKKIQVGSTGNLGLSIGIAGAALGFDAVVHMSADAKQWKKDLLRKRGVTVREYEGDYSEAVKSGREGSASDPDSYFVDDENSLDLLLGYAVAGERVRGQLETLKIPVDREHPLFVHLPCGVGGAPSGIAYGLKQIYGDDVFLFLDEPVQAPCMLAGIASRKYSGISVSDLGLSGKTLADGLAVGRCSRLAAEVLCPMTDGAATVSDGRLYGFMRNLWETERLFAEPSACAGFQSVSMLFGSRQGEGFRSGFSEKQIEQSTQIVWATGGSMVPEDVRKELLGTE